MRVDPRRRSRRVVVDTNVWISGFLTRNGTPARLARRIVEDRVPVFSDATFAELESRLWLPKFDRYLDMDTRRRVLDDAGSAADWVKIPPDIAVQASSRDPDDDKFIHAALAAGAPWLVSGDHDLLGVSGVDGLCILTPGDALRLLD